MNDTDEHLMRCFASAFPSATRDEIRAAKTLDAIPGWDSLRMVSLLAVLDDEFGVVLPELPGAEPFDAVKQYLLQQGLMT